MMKILFACIFIYIHVYVKKVLLLVFRNSLKRSSSKAEREEKRVHKQARQRDVTLAAQVKSHAFPVLSLPSSFFLPVAAKHREEGEYPKVMCRSFLCGASRSWKNEGRLEGFAVLKKISQLYA